MRRRTAIVIMGFIMLVSRPLPAPAEPGSIDARRELARALLGAWLPLESGLAVSVREGTQWRATLAGGGPLAEVTLVRGDDWKVVTVALD